MKNESFLGLSALVILGVCGTIRRISRVRSSRKLFRELAGRSGLLSAPTGYYRVAISGVSSGIGKACLDILRDYPSVDILTLGRHTGANPTIYVDLADVNLVYQAAKNISSSWYGRKLLSPGIDIVINNAGVFTAATPKDVWITNFISPSLITEEVTRSFSGAKAIGRSLRFVQVTSRLEKQSILDFQNFADLSQSYLSGVVSASSKDVYANSKRALIFHTASIASKYRETKSLSFLTVTPGMVNSNLGRKSVWGWLWWLTAGIRFILLRHPIEGAVAVLSAAFTDMHQTGLYMGYPGEKIEDITVSRDHEAANIASQLLQTYLHPSE
jgi:NAD(P)-dependent dehydrogenase (short-subunit alcohol dehydrogenase family)